MTPAARINEEPYGDPEEPAATCRVLAVNEGLVKGLAFSSSVSYMGPSSYEVLACRLTFLFHIPSSGG